MKYLARTRASFEGHHLIEGDPVHGRDHGHQFTISVLLEVGGDAELATAWILTARKALNDLIEEFNYRSVNEMAPIHPSIAGLARYAHDRLVMLIDTLYSVEVSDGTGDTAIVSKDHL